MSLRVFALLLTKAYNLFWDCQAHGVHNVKAAVFLSPRCQTLTLFSLNLLSTLTDSCQQITSGQDIGYRSPPIGRKRLRIACFHRKRTHALNERSKPSRQISGRSSSCATSRDGRLRKPVVSSSFPRGISGYSSTVPDQRCGTSLRSTSRRSRLNIL